MKISRLQLYKFSLEVFSHLTIEITETVLTYNENEI
jgi:hypothetical protein